MEGYFVCSECSGVIAQVEQEVHYAQCLDLERIFEVMHLNFWGQLSYQLASVVYLRNRDIGGQ